MSTRDIIEAAEAHMAAWDAMEEALNYRTEVLHEGDHGQIVSDQWKAELNASVREANTNERRTADALRAALAAYRKEQGDE